MEGYRPIRRLFNIIRIQPVENFRYPIDCQTCNWYISSLIMLIYNVQWYRSAFRCRWMEYNRQMVDAASWRSLVTELPMGCLYIAAGSEMPPPQNELFAIASEDRGFLSTIDVGSLTLCWKFVWQLREFFFFYKFLHRFFTTTGKMLSGLKLPFLPSWERQASEFSSVAPFYKIDLTVWTILDMHFDARVSCILLYEKSRDDTVLQAGELTRFTRCNFLN
jgi:hypothetical protein